MKIEVNRTTYTDNSTIGELSIDGVFQCYTLEDKVRKEGVKIQGETAIPSGSYEVKLTWSPKYKRTLPLLLDVPNFSGIRIHSGNDEDDTEGCILVGETKSKDFVGKSRDAFNALFPLLTAAAERGDDIVLVLSDGQDKPKQAKKE